MRAPVTVAIACLAAFPFAACSLSQNLGSDLGGDAGPGRSAGATGGSGQASGASSGAGSATGGSSGATTGSSGDAGAGGPGGDATAPCVFDQSSFSACTFGQ